MRLGQVVVLGRIVRQVVELPAIGVEVGEYVGGEGRAEVAILFQRFGEARPGEGTDRPPAFVVEMSGTLPSR